jgi:hypothetical protein
MRSGLWLVAAMLLGCGSSTEVLGNGGHGAQGGAAGQGAGVPGGAGGSGGTGGTTSGTQIWPADAEQLDATETGGGEIGPAPPGSDCDLGEAHYDVVVASRAFVWSECPGGANWDDPWLMISGSRTLTAPELQQIDTAMLALTVASGQSCGADKALLTVDVTTPHGTTEYVDSFYECNGGDTIYVDNIDAVFAVLGQLATP